jgi:hypothetical protein
MDGDVFGWRLNGFEGRQIVDKYNPNACHYNHDDKIEKVSSYHNTLPHFQLKLLLHRLLSEDQKVISRDAADLVRRKSPRSDLKVI